MVTIIIYIGIGYKIKSVIKPTLYLDTCVTNNFGFYFDIQNKKVLFRMDFSIESFIIK